ncbi:hypothetical protein C7S20_09075 [Christiangramia fulva]|uniref:Uncharacterized protein n=1 Tax=Christiangramia fulva TaxID=2126553 RepID=A0A2R3Z566_9FLAO|nr:DUF6090 family protein [Christiangramia fulva]AVR45410.1 hypothetical protein C7S20_09075 [Christiangramia fulva]
MIKFFRNIRRKLINKSKLTSYLLYALGEIILVVIGILIALQINNWNEERKIRKEEQQLLKSISEEFQANLKILDQAKQMNDYIIARASGLGEYTGPKLENFDERKLSDLMVGAFKYEARFIPNQGTVNETINSGKLSVLSNDELRKAISAWQSALELVKNQEDYVVGRRDIAHAYFLNNGNFRRHLYLINEAIIKVSPSRFPNNDFKFLEDESFESNLYLFITASSNLNKNFYSILDEKIKFIITEADKGIKKK